MPEPITVLIADDKIDDRISLRDLLEMRGYTVLEAANTEDAFAIAAGSVPDLVVLDIEMPQEDGYVVCKRLRSDARTRNVPVLMLTCHGFVAERVAGLRAGADDYIIKPCENEELLARIDALFRRYPPRPHFFDRIEHARDGIEAAEVFRQPIVVLSVDVQGSSKPPASSSEEYHRAILYRDYHALVESAVARQGGAPVAWAGDGGTTEFPDPTQAVAAAQEILQTRAEHPLVSQLVLRIGIAAGHELLEPAAAIGKRNSQTHNRAGHFQKYSSPNMITVGREVVSVLIEATRFRERSMIDDEIVFEGS